MRSANARSLFNYWLSLKGAAPAPARKAIEPRPMKAMLDEIFILDWHDRDLVSFRLAGTALCERMGRELRDMNFLALFTGDCRRTVRSLMENMMHSGDCGVLAATAETPSGMVLEVEYLLLPLTDDEGRIRMILGGAFAEPAKARLMDPPVLRQSVEGVRVVDERTPLAEPEPADFMPPLMPVKRPHLRLVVDRDALGQGA